MKNVFLFVCGCEVIVEFLSKTDFIIKWKPLKEPIQDVSQRIAKQQAIGNYLMAEGFIPNFEEIV